MLYVSVPDIHCYRKEASYSELSNSHAHYGYEIYLLTKGEGVVYINHKQYDIKEKSIIFINRLERHSFKAQKTPYERYITFVSSNFIMANFKDIRLLSIFLHRPDNFCHVQQLSDEIFDRILGYMQLLSKECSMQSTFYKMKSSSILTEILIDLYRSYPFFFPNSNHNNFSQIVFNVQKIINDHYNEPLTLQNIANENFVNRQVLSKAFKDIIGCTFQDYLIQLRMSEAKRLLVTTDLSVAEIAELVGYQNVTNFIKIFKSKELVTPLKYRKQYDFESLKDLTFY